MTDFPSFVAASGRRQQDVAARLGISQPHLSLILAGKKRPSLALAVRIERFTDGAVPAGSWVNDDD